MFKMKRFLASIAAAIAFAGASEVRSQEYPTKPITVIVPWSASGIVDIAARVIGQKIQAELGQSMIIENKPGAGGMIGADVVARSAPDGYTLLVTSSGLNMNVALGQKISVEVATAFVPIRVVAWAPAILVAYPGLKLASVKDLVAMAKSKPGKMTYASAGIGSPAHFAAEMFRSEVGIDVVHVPYKGAPPAMTDQMAGRVDFHFANATVALPQIKAGTVTALAITADKRSPLAPDVPTMAEAGYPEFKAGQWIGYFAPANTPRKIVDKLVAAIGNALKDPGVQAALGRQAMEIDTDSIPGSFSELMKTDLRRWQSVVKAANIKLD
jgi:tripartite-type tricarboxylate transporter receptor subunit TctC